LAKEENTINRGIKKSVIAIKKLSAGSWQGGKQWRVFDFELSLKSIALIHYTTVIL